MSGPYLGEPSSRGDNNEVDLSEGGLLRMTGRSEDGVTMCARLM